MELRRVYNSLIGLAVALSAAAVPAYRGPLVRTDADGVEKNIYLHGDKWYHYTTDEQGNWLNEKTLAPLTEEQKSDLQQAKTKRRQTRRAPQQRKIGSEPNIAPRGLFILVNFTDKAFTTPRDTIDSMLNAVHYTRDYLLKSNARSVKVHSEGSARQYFHDQSYGQYNPVFDVVGPYDLAHNIAYYGENDDANVGYMIKEACEMANQDGADFTKYDNDNDGWVDFVYVLYAGYGEADGGGDSTVWPHNYSLDGYYINCRVDGKRVGNYACSNEISGQTEQYDGVGTFCHEFSHVLGLPDLYETNQPTWGLHTLLDWDILDYGCYNNYSNTPSGYSSYERFYMGWLTPRILTDSEYVSLPPIDQEEALLLCEGDRHNLNGADPNPSKFYLLECRQPSGWDAYLPGKGMLITKIQYSEWKWEANTVNNSASSFGVDILEAKANRSRLALATDAFPAGATEWTAFADHEITDISLDEDNIIHFSYRGAEVPETQDVITVNGEEVEVSGRKILRNGQLYILRNGKTYTILGYENHQL